VPPAPKQNTSRKCGWPKDHIFFLKLHKCGSSTVQNILMRRGLSHGLNFVLPQKGMFQFLYCNIFTLFDFPLF
jgi:hypothetical protein